MSEESLDGSDHELSGWSLAWPIAYGVVVGLVFLTMLVATGFIVVALLTGTVTAGLGASIMLAVLFPVLLYVSAWLCWTFTIKNFGDLLTEGRFTAGFSPRLKAFDARFGWSALLSLLVVPLVPMLQLLD